MIVHLEAQGRLIQASRRITSPAPAVGGATRGRITSFSKASRRRLIHLSARLNPAASQPKFITLTFALSPCPDQAKAAFKRFKMRLIRRHPAFSAIWRLELQTRGAIHFHLLAFNLPFIPQRELQAMWEGCTGEERSIVDVRAVKGGRRVMSYMSKYIAKITQDDASTSLDTGAYQHELQDVKVGRWWGYINKDALPFAKLEEIVIEDPEIMYYFQFSVRALSRGKAGHAPTRATLFDDDAYAALAWVRRHARAIHEEDASTTIDT